MKLKHMSGLSVYSLPALLFLNEGDLKLRILTNYLGIGILSPRSRVCPRIDIPHAMLDRSFSAPPNATQSLSTTTQCAPHLFSVAAWRLNHRQRRTVPHRDLCILTPSLSKGIYHMLSSLGSTPALGYGRGCAAGVYVVAVSIRCRFWFSFSFLIGPVLTYFFKRKLSQKSLGGPCSHHRLATVGARLASGRDSRIGAGGLCHSVHARVFTPGNALPSRLLGKRIEFLKHEGAGRSCKLVDVGGGEAGRGDGVENCEPDVSLRGLNVIRDISGVTYPCRGSARC